MKGTLILVLVIVLSVFFSYTSHSQDQPAKRSPGVYSKRGRISGKISEEHTGLPLPRASVYFPDLKKGTIADNNGMYISPSLNAGRHLIQITHQGYSTIIETIEIDGNIQKDFALKEEIVESEEVTVTGVPSAIRARQSPQSIDIVRRKDFLKVISGNPIDALTKTVPGVSGLSTGPAISKPFIRGLGYNRVVVVNDGIRQEGQQWGDEHGIEIDGYSIQRVEVLKGPSSLMYGSDAIAGVINIISQQIPPEGNLTGVVTTEFQNNNRLRGIFGTIGGTKKGWSGNVYGSYKAAQDFRNKYDGYVFNSKFNEENFGGMIGYSGTWGHSNLLASNFNQHIGMVEGERDSITGRFIKALPGDEEAIATNADFKTLDPFVPFQHVKHFKLVSDNVVNIRRNKLDLIFGYEQNQRLEFGNADDPKLPDLHLDLKTISYNLRFHLPHRKKWKTTAGLSGMTQSNKNKGNETLIPDYDLWDLGGFIVTQFRENKFIASGGLRFDHRNVDGKTLIENGMAKFTAFTRHFSNVSGSAGASYEASKQLMLKINIARGFRAPSLAELSSNGAHEGTTRYETGNNNLKSETSLQGDAGIELNAEHISLDACFFLNSIDNFIFYEKLLNNQGTDSILTEPNGELRVFRFVQKDARLYGAEFTMDLHPHPLDWLHIKNTFSYTRGRFTEKIDNSRNLPLMPAARLMSELAVNFLPKGKTLRNIFASIESDYALKQNHPFTGYNTEISTNGYWIMNAAAGTDFVSKKGRKLLTIYISGMNLWDNAYQDFLNRLRYADKNNVTGRTGVFNMGRNFSFKINAPLDFEWK